MSVIKWVENKNRMSLGVSVCFFVIFFLLTWTFSAPLPVFHWFVNSCLRPSFSPCHHLTLSPYYYSLNLPIQLPCLFQIQSSGWKLLHAILRESLGTTEFQQISRFLLEYAKSRPVENFTWFGFFPMCLSYWVTKWWLLLTAFFCVLVKFPKPSKTSL